MEPIGDRVCIVHVGTHKTGTTSLQIFLDGNRAAFSSGGVHLADAGRHENYGWGNHQLAWDLLVKGTSGDLALLTEELRRVGSPAAIITSEDLSLLYHRPETLELLNAAIRSAGYLPKIVVYLRPQAAYIESMYAERVRHDRNIRFFADFIDVICRTGDFVLENGVTHLPFRYTALLRPFADAFGRENLIVRAYESGRGTTHIYQDFLLAIAAAYSGFAATETRVRIAEPRVNESLPFLGLLETAYLTIFGGSFEETQPLTIMRQQYPDFPEELLMSRFALLSHREALRILEVFAEDNKAVALEYGVSIPFVRGEHVPAKDHPAWQRAALERPIYDRILSDWLTKTNAIQQPAK
ncbi:MAG TPA: hypothetical protein VGN11_10620 [Candidatus Baltobacteraceae bacterium]|nr:hypothetical protein [Candidatus Baltobacteraceae bacterium]